VDKDNKLVRGYVYLGCVEWGKGKKIPLMYQPLAHMYYAGKRACPYLEPLLMTFHNIQWVLYILLDRSYGGCR